MKKLRVVQWTTGLVAKQAVKAMVDRPEIELVGAYAYSKEKVGKDLGELAGLNRTLGVAATDSMDEILTLKPDCVVYMPLHPSLEHVETLLKNGINVVTTAFITGKGLGDNTHDRLDVAAKSGNATLFGSGIHPGITDYLAGAASGLCKDVSYVRLLEAADLSMWATDPNQSEFGWGRPAGDPGHAEDIERVTAVDVDSLDLLARQFGVELSGTRCEVKFAHATEDLDFSGLTVKQGHVAGMDIRWIGLVGDVDRFEINLRWVLGNKLDVDWEMPSSYFVFDVHGQPMVNMTLTIMPENIETMTMDDFASFGQLITAAPVVNAIKSVVAAPAGFLSHADLPALTAPIRKNT